MRLALFIHLVTFAVGFGSVMLVDITGALWAIGKVQKDLVVRMGAIAQWVIWVSVVLLVISGLVLLPDNITPQLKIKLVAVGILVINGFLLAELHKATEKAHQDKFTELPNSLQLRSIILISISQMMWWTAMFIGFLSSSGYVL
jgi:cytochrome bd-type quinol oxidase subunit 2